MKRIITAACAVSLLLATTACTSTPKVAVQQTDDFKLSCEGLNAEFKKLDTVMEEADHNKGVNTANVAAVLFFWPAAVGNYMSAADAEKLVEKRRSHLMEIYKSKGCV